MHASSRRIAKICLAVVLAAILAGRTAPRADAAARHGWPINTLTYRIEDRSIREETRRAATVWNRAKEPFRFEPVHAGKRPDLLIGVVPGGGCQVGRRSGYAHIGYDPASPKERIGVASCGPLREEVAIHELGHVLGLGHTSERCHLMHPILEFCAPERPLADEVAAVRKIARQRDRARGDAPGTPELTVIAHTHTYPSSGAQDHIELQLELQVRGTWSEPFWTAPRIVVEDPGGVDDLPCAHFDGLRLGVYAEDDHSWTRTIPCGSLTGPLGRYSVHGEATDSLGRTLVSPPFVLEGTPVGPVFETEANPLDDPS